MAEVQVQGALEEGNRTRKRKTPGFSVRGKMERVWVRVRGGARMRGKGVCRLLRG